MSSQRSVLGKPLAPCSKVGMPTTGFNRDGKCGMSSGDKGLHHVCVKRVGRADANFCTATGQPDWCSGMEDWCVCEWAFDKAVERLGCDALEVDCAATNARALEHYAALKPDAAAAACLRAKCPKPLD